MHSDPNRRRPSKANGLQILVAILSAATVLSVAISLDHRMRADASSAAAPAPAAATPAVAPPLPETLGSDPSLPAAADALRGNRRASGDDATTF
jgi:hypothetical protein